MSAKEWCIKELKLLPWKEQLPLQRVTTVCNCLAIIIPFLTGNVQAILSGASLVPLFLFRYIEKDDPRILQIITLATIVLNAAFGACAAKWQALHPASVGSSMVLMGYALFLVFLIGSLSLLRAAWKKKSKASMFGWTLLWSFSVVVFTWSTVSFIKETFFSASL